MPSVESNPLLPRAAGGKIWGEAVHASAVCIGGRALLIFGPSGAGKSRLAFALITASTADCPIRLVGDDRILLAWQRTGLVARPHPRITGFIERRGLGIVAVPFVDSAPVAAVVDLGLERLGRTSLPAILQQNLRSPLDVYDGPASSDAVLAHWRDACTTQPAKTTISCADRAKD